MLRLLGHPAATCGGVTRRELLQLGAMSLFGASISTPALAENPSRLSAKAKSVILIDLFGGPSHIDSFDPKPDAPQEIRGEFGVIPTSIPGLRICEHLPLLSKIMHQLCLIRTVTHGYNSHNPYAVMTGYTGGQDQVDYYSKPTNHPSMGSVCQYFGIGTKRDLPGYVMLPAFPGYSQGLRRAGPYGGYLGGQFDPMFSTCEPDWGKKIDTEGDAYNHKLVPMGDPQLPKMPTDITLDALKGRQSLLQQFDGQLSKIEKNSATKVMNQKQQQAFDLLTANTAKKAFDLDQEPLALRDRYGRNLFGSSALLARRLVEAGVTFVTIHTEAKGNGHWDTHSNNFNMLKHWLLPYLDRSLSALVLDLADRGLLESTLIVVNGDMGRTPKINPAAGRDHWPRCGFCLFAGGGTKAGSVHGSSDSMGAYPKDYPVAPGDLVATVYHLLGVDPEATVPDHTKRPIPISHGGKPIDRILA